eukprot:TRINITY_DN3102_c0_g1_i2.p1 TRINITY_DN3102_c0_g1~~TRINITY_DN3102_c0_g1_i2.p1  ORF type:complete len:623 (-),score=124.37 TRINITY_DN3102_c0_g1_i2:55-1923(-)
MEKCHAFYKANIHERRTAAYVARAFPFVLFMLVLALLLWGVFFNTVVLLWVTATLNVAMWLWIVSTAIACIDGAYNVQDVLRSVEEPKPAKASEVATTGSTQESQELPKHVIVLPNYKEDEEMLAETLQNLQEAKGSKDFIVVLAMEAREKESRTKAESLQAKHDSSFALLHACFHPSTLEEIHQDDSSDPEVPGKASNLKYAVEQALKEVSTRSEFSKDSTILTVADADVFFHPSYFDYIGQEFVKLREDGKEQHKWTFWQAPQLSWRNFYECPVVSRTWGYISSLWEFGGVSELRTGGHHMVFSAYSLPLQLAADVQCWDGDVIAEDHHSYLKTFFFGAHRMYQVPPHWMSSPVKVQPVMLPVKSTSVNSSEGYWASWTERWSQATRHAQGVAEVSYAYLTAWDMLCSVPMSALSFSFLVKLVKVIMKPTMMHLVSTMQAIALAVLTLCWLASGNELQMCPETLTLFNWGQAGDTILCGLAGAWVLTWPVVVPFALIITANYLMIRIAFLEPAENHKNRSLWHAADGCVEPFHGSKRARTMGLILIDIVIFLGPIMAVYGVVAEMLAYWNVMIRGNSFTYVSASKALGSTVYGSTGRSEEPAAKGSEISEETEAAKPATE